MTPHAHDSAALRQSLDELASRARRHLSRWCMARDLRETSRHALWWLAAGPAGLFLVQAARAWSSPAPAPMSAWTWGLATLAGPVLFVTARVAWLASHRRIDRRTSLGAFDDQLDHQDRLVTADEFLGTAVDGDTPSNQFKQAAIEDATPRITEALGTALTPAVLPAWVIAPRSWLALPAVAALVLGAIFLGFVATNRNGVNPAAVLAGGALETAPATSASTQINPPPARPRVDHASPDQKPETSDPATSSDASPRSQRSDQNTDGASHAGGQANSRSISNAMSSSGTPSNQQTPSKPLEEDTLQEQQKPLVTQPKRLDMKKPEPQATSATSGQGQSKSSSSDTSKIPATDQPDRAGADKDDGKDEGAVQDQAEEEKTSGVERPSLRKNKPPVDRNLSPRPNGDQPNPDANGRSGPGARKKTRGVPAMILGIPTPDRVQGTSNPGPSKVTQEHSTPKEEPQSTVTAGDRQARTRAFGVVDHPLLVPWMQTIIERYFLQIHFNNKK